MAVLCALLALPFQPVMAGMDCYVDPVQEYSWTGKITSAVFMRNNACSQGSSVLRTLSQGTEVNVVATTDGWYYVEYGGSRGWVGSQFLTVTAKGATGKTWSSYHEFMQANPSRIATVTSPAPVVKTDPTLVSRLRGYILLDVQSHGEAWYLNPTDNSRYYMKDGAIAYEMMRSFGLGISEVDYQRLEAGDMALRGRLLGRIVLRAQAHGEAYYIHPKTAAVHYLKDGPAAYEVMRFNSMGIVSSDLNRIPSREIPIMVK